MFPSENTLKRLQAWYELQCDGDWEHEYGIKIGNLDNPGWEIEIDLAGTSLEQKPLEAAQEERDDNNWVAYRIEEARFRGFGGPKNLEELLNIFLDWADK